MLTKIKKKARKLEVAYKYRYKKNRVSCFWHLGSPNFGDDLNPYLFQTLLQKEVFRDSKQQFHHILGVGSILERANAKSIVVGSGFIRPEGSFKEQPAQILAVRGELTQAKLGYSNLLLGDPGIIVPSLLGIQSSNEVDLVVVPHVDFYQQVVSIYGRRVRVVDPSKEFDQVIAEIASASVVISQSLHGLVMADGLGIPNLWVSPHGKMIGGEFKFMDYYSTTQHAKAPITFEQALADNYWKKKAFVSEPNIPALQYESLYKELLLSSQLFSK